MGPLFRVGRVPACRESAAKEEQGKLEAFCGLAEVLRGIIVTTGSTCTAAWVGAAALVAWGVFGVGPTQAPAATIAPPMLDITRQCGASSKRNMRAMSECVVAESEARAEVLQKWNKLSDASAEKCIKQGVKAKKFPYATLAKCVAVEPVDMQAAAKPPIVTKTESGSSVTDWFLKTTGIRK